MVDPTNGVFVEASVRLDRMTPADNAWWAFWLMAPGSSDCKTDGGPLPGGFNAYDGHTETGVELDLFEFVPDLNNGYNQALFRYQGGRGKNCTSPGKAKLAPEDKGFTYEGFNPPYGVNLPDYMDGNYHRLGLYYAQDCYAVYIDDTLLWQVTEQTNPGWITDRAKNAIRLTWEIQNTDNPWTDRGGNFANTAIADDPTVYIDYVNVWEKKETANGLCSGGPDPIPEPEPEPEPELSAPTNFTIDPDNGTVLNWEAGEGLAPDGYDIRRGLTENLDPEEHAYWSLDSPETSWPDPGAQLGTTYFYQIVPWAGPKTAPTYGPPSEVVSVTATSEPSGPVNPNAPAAPINVTDDLSNGTKLTWEAGEGLTPDGYDVQRNRVTSPEDLEVVGYWGVRSPKFTDPQAQVGVEYRYRVVAWIQGPTGEPDDRFYSPATETITVVAETEPPEDLDNDGVAGPPNPNAPAAPANLRAINTADELTLNWDVGDGLAPDGFEINRNRVSDPEDETVKGYWSINTSTPTFTDPGVQRNQSYTYSITAWLDDANGVRQYSNRSDEIAVVAKSGPDTGPPRPVDDNNPTPDGIRNPALPPARPFDVRITGGRLTWKMPPSPDYDYQLTVTSARRSGQPWTQRAVQNDSALRATQFANKSWQFSYPITGFTAAGTAFRVEAFHPADITVAADNRKTSSRVATLAATNPGREIGNFLTTFNAAGTSSLPGAWLGTRSDWANTTQFDDQFNGTALSNQWYSAGQGITPSYDRNQTFDRNQAKPRDGKLEMVLDKTSGMYPYLGTGNNQGDGYHIDASNGVFVEASVRLDKAAPADNAWWAFWLMNPDGGAFDGNPDTGSEVDIFEFIPDVNNGYHSALYRANPGPTCPSTQHTQAARIPTPGDCFTYDIPSDLPHVNMANYMDGNYHRLGMYYSHQRYAFYIDNQLIWQVTDPNFITKAEELSLRLTWELQNSGGLWTEHGGSIVTTARDDNPTVFVDWINVWEKTDAATPEPPPGDPDPENPDPQNPNPDGPDDPTDVNDPNYDPLRDPDLQPPVVEVTPDVDSVTFDWTDWALDNPRDGVRMDITIHNGFGPGGTGSSFSIVPGPTFWTYEAETEFQLRHGVTYDYTIKYHKSKDSGTVLLYGPAGEGSFTIPFPPLPAVRELSVGYLGADLSLSWFPPRAAEGAVAGYEIHRDGGRYGIQPAGRHDRRVDWVETDPRALFDRHNYTVYAYRELPSGAHALGAPKAIFSSPDTDPNDDQIAVESISLVTTGFQARDNGYLRFNYVIPINRGVEDLKIKIDGVRGRDLPSPDEPITDPDANRTFWFNVLPENFARATSPGDHSLSISGGSRIGDTTHFGQTRTIWYHVAENGFITPDGNPPLAPVEDLVAVQDPYRPEIAVTWLAHADSASLDSQQPSGYIIDRNDAYYTATLTPGFDDEDVEPGQSYEYKVTPYFDTPERRVYGPPNTSERLLVKEPPTVITPDAPTNLKIEPVPGELVAKLTWTAPPGWDADLITGYFIYRDDFEDFKALEWEDPDSTFSRRVSIDSDVEYGKYYTYTVQAWSRDEFGNTVKGLQSSPVTYRATRGHVDDTDGFEPPPNFVAAMEVTVSAASDEAVTTQLAAQFYSMFQSNRDESVLNWVDFRDSIQVFNENLIDNGGGDVALTTAEIAAMQDNSAVPEPAALPQHGEEQSRIYSEILIKRIADYAATQKLTAIIEGYEPPYTAQMLDALRIVSTEPDPNLSVEVRDQQLAGHIRYIDQFEKATRIARSNGFDPPVDQVYENAFNLYAQSLLNTSGSGYDLLDAHTAIRDGLDYLEFRLPAFGDPYWEPIPAEQRQFWNLWDQATKEERVEYLGWNTTLYEWSEHALNVYEYQLNSRKADTVTNRLLDLVWIAAPIIIATIVGPQFGLWAATAFGAGAVVTTLFVIGGTILVDQAAHALMGHADRKLKESAKLGLSQGLAHLGNLPDLSPGQQALVATLDLLNRLEGAWTIENLIDLLIEDLKYALLDGIADGIAEIAPEAFEEFIGDLVSTFLHTLDKNDWDLEKTIKEMETVLLEAAGMEVKEILGEIPLGDNWQKFGDALADLAGYAIMVKGDKDQIEKYYKTTTAKLLAEAGGERLADLFGGSNAMQNALIEDMGTLVLLAAQTDEDVVIAYAFNRIGDRVSSWFISSNTNEGEEPTYAIQRAGDLLNIAISNGHDLDLMEDQLLAELAEIAIELIASLFPDCDGNPDMQQANKEIVTGLTEIDVDNPDTVINLFEDFQNRAEIAGGEACSGGDEGAGDVPGFTREVLKLTNPTLVRADSSGGRELTMEAFPNTRLFLPKRTGFGDTAEIYGRQRSDDPWGEAEVFLAVEYDGTSDDVVRFEREGGCPSGSIAFSPDLKASKAGPVSRSATAKVQVNGGSCGTAEGFREWLIGLKRSDLTGNSSPLRVAADFGGELRFEAKDPSLGFGQFAFSVTRRAESGRIIEINSAPLGEQFELAVVWNSSGQIVSFSEDLQCIAYEKPAEAADARLILNATMLNAAELASFQTRQVYTEYLTPGVATTTRRPITGATADQFSDHSAAEAALARALERIEGTVPTLGPPEDPTTFRIEDRDPLRGKEPFEYDLGLLNKAPALLAGGSGSGAKINGVHIPDERNFTGPVQVIPRASARGVLNAVTLVANVDLQVLDAVDFCPGDLGSDAARTFGRTLEASRLEATPHDDGGYWAKPILFEVNTTMDTTRRIVTSRYGNDSDNDGWPDHQPWTGATFTLDNCPGEHEPANLCGDPTGRSLSGPKGEAMTDEGLRQVAVGDMVDALESYANEHGTHMVSGGGYLGNGAGWAFYEGAKYPASTAGVLTDGGHLRSDMVYDPLWTSKTSTAGDVLIYRCKDRVGVFSRNGDGQPSANDSAWWTNNGCTRYPIDTLKATHFKVSDPLPDEAQMAVGVMLAALESYADVNGSYVVEGGGHNGNGNGWAFWEASNYPTAISNLLIADSHLVAGAIPDPYAGGDTSGVGDVLVYTCKDRVGAFTRDTAAQASKADRDWWTENNCNRYPIDTLNSTYFRVSKPLPPDDAQLAVGVMMAALESYGTDNGSYTVEGGGHNGNGSGWAFWEAANYPTAISDVLITAGHLAADAIPDPYADGDTSGVGDILVYPCANRVGVFTRDTTAQAAKADRDWWTENNCSRYVIDTLNATYYQLSQPLS